MEDKEKITIEDWQFGMLINELKRIALCVEQISRDLQEDKKGKLL